MGVVAREGVAMAEDALLGQRRRGGGDVGKALVSYVNVPVALRTVSPSLSRGSQRTWFESTRLCHQFVRAHALGKAIADRDNADMGRLVLRGDGL